MVVVLTFPFLEIDIHHFLWRWHPFITWLHRFGTRFWQRHIFHYHLANFSTSTPANTQDNWYWKDRNQYAASQAWLTHLVSQFKGDVGIRLPRFHPHLLCGDFSNLANQLITGAFSHNVVAFINNACGCLIGDPDSSPQHQLATLMDSCFSGSFVITLDLFFFQRSLGWKKCFLFPSNTWKFHGQGSLTFLYTNTPSVLSLNFPVPITAHNLHRRM